MREGTGDRTCCGRCQVRGDRGDSSEEWTGKRGAGETFPCVG